MDVVMVLFKDITYDARVKREARAIAEAGHKVYIYCLFVDFNIPTPRLHDNINIIRIPLQIKRMRRLNGRKKPVIRYLNSGVKLYKDLLATKQFYNYLQKDLLTRDLDIHVIHCHDLNTLQFGTKLKKKFKSILVYDAHEIFNEMASKHVLEKIIGRAIEKQLLKKVDHIITVNSLLKDFLQKSYSLVNRSFTIIQNIPEKANGKTLSDDYFHNLFKLNNSDRILYYQGGINPERGLDDCIKALEYLPSNYILILLGDGRLKRELETKVQRDGIYKKRVFFHPQVSSQDLSAYTKLAHIGLVMYENTCKNNYLSTPNKVYEYMQAYLPTVSSNHPGKCSVVKNYQTGVCSEETPKDIAKSIITIENDYEYYKQNCITASDEVTWLSESKKLVKLYNKIESDF
ncbi:glycosyltransferase [Halobacillus litoralis]|uniref:glycosyltransferase n=1 Tax=Halobacillus litoralis TaxID=45668 RepID=UPI001CD2397C|nr:glycosyltransferase [Halobacillus litoralis]MCA0970974.1 glycosyltransferase [Halobacillus litoralis]